MAPPRRRTSRRDDAKLPRNRPPSSGGSAGDGGIVQSYGADGSRERNHISVSVAVTLAAGLVWVATLCGGALRVGAQLYWLASLGGVVLIVNRRERTSSSRTIGLGIVVLIAMVGGARAWNERAVVMTGQCSGHATLRTDPAMFGPGTSVVVQLGHVRYKASAFGPAGWRLGRRLAGESVWLSGSCGELRGPFARRDRIAHISGTIAVTTVSEEFDEGSGVVRAANRMRRTMMNGVRTMPSAMRALFAGLVIGDDRQQPRSMITDFRSSGLSHLCAVSGQNVAYLLAVMSPVLSRLRRGTKWWATIALLAWFIVLTRAEPSVLRAACMSAMVATNAALRMGMNARAVLGACVITLLMVDPMLAWNVGFALSVGATAGLAWLASGIGRLVGGGGVLSATLAAQVGTMPISWAVFGYVPVVSLIANPLTVAVAGAVMMIGLPCALLAGLCPPIAPLVSWILTIPVAWIAAVAHTCAQVSPHGATNVVLWGVVALVLWMRVRHSRRRDTDVAG